MRELRTEFTNRSRAIEENIDSLVNTLFPGEGDNQGETEGEQHPLLQELSAQAGNAIFLGFNDVISVKQGISYNIYIMSILIWNYYHCIYC